MANFTVFYSWQSDLPRRVTRDIIYNATNMAIEKLKLDVSIEDSPRLDHDTLGASGIPEIAGTIFKKIEGCGIFLADLSLVGSIDMNKVDGPIKRLPNPNVLLELGYAAAKIGWERVILVMNTHYGSPEDLIFDLRHRRFPLIFNVAPDSQKNQDKVQLKLSAKIEEAIRATLQSEYVSVQEAIGRLDTVTLALLKDAARFEYFDLPRPNSLLAFLEGYRKDDAVIRLLELGLIRCDIAPDTEQYFYHWTYLGKLVLEKLQLRNANPVGRSIPGGSTA